MTPIDVEFWFGLFVGTLCGFIVGWLCCEGFVWRRIAKRSAALEAACRVADKANVIELAVAAYYEAEHPAPNNEEAAMAFLKAKRPTEDTTS